MPELRLQAAVAARGLWMLRDNENVPFVYVETGTNQFGRRSVQIGDSKDGKTQIVAGLHAGEKVAGDGSLFLQFANALQQ